MKCLTNLIIISLLFLFPAYTYAQTDANVMGHVIDENNGEHMPFVTISIKGTTIASATDATGHYLLKNMKPGKHILVAQMVGYQTEEQPIELERGKTIDINFTLKPSTFNLNEIVVSANRNETRSKEASVIVGVLNQKQLEATNSCNLAQGLNFQSGLRVENNCQNCGFQQVRINGLDGPYSQILIDSRAIFSSLTGVYGIEQIPASMIDRVEIVKGGGSALFGSNAIGGTINIITREPLYNSFSVGNNLSFIGGYSPDNVFNMNTSLVTDNHKAGIYLFGMFRDRKEWDVNDDNFSELGKLKSETGGFRSYFKPTDNSKFTLEYHRIHEYRRGGDSLQLPPHKVRIAEMAEHNINGGGFNYHLFSKDHKHNFNIYSSLQSTIRNTYYGANYNNDAYGNTDGLTSSSGMQYSYHFDKLLFMPSQLTGGVEYSYDKIHDVMLGYKRDLKQTTNIAGGYFQNEWKNEKFTILLGARLDKHNLIDNAIFSPRLNFRFAPVDNLNLRAGYATGFRAPQTFDEDLHITAVNGVATFIKNNKDLKPEYSHSYSTSADYTFEIGTWGVNIVADLFHTYLKDVFVLEKIGTDAQGNMIKERRNGKGAIVKGVNLETKIIPANWLNCQIGLTLQNSEYKEPESWSDDSNVAPIKKMMRTPDVYGYYTANLKLNKKFGVSLSGTYTGSMYAPHFEGYINADKMEKTPNFIDAAIRTTYNFKVNDTFDIQLNGGVQNIFNSFQKDFDKGKNRDAGYVYGPGLPRTVFVGIKFGLF